MKFSPLDESVESRSPGAYPWRALIHSTLALWASLAAGAFIADTALAQQFTDVSFAAGLHRDATRSWGNPMWGDFNNDGLLDLFVPNHEAPGGITQGGIYPYIYLNNGDGTFTDVITTSGIIEQMPDTVAGRESRSATTMAMGTSTSTSRSRLSKAAVTHRPVIFCLRAMVMQPGPT